MVGGNNKEKTRELFLEQIKYMSEETKPQKRLAAVAKECNVGVGHIVEFLVSKGFSVENKPTTKLTEEMYMVCLKEYNTDLADRLQAESLNMGKSHGLVLENRRVEEFPQLKKPKEEPQELQIQNLGNSTATPKVSSPEVAPEEESSKTKETLKAVVEEDEKTSKKISSKKVKLEGPTIVGKIENLEDDQEKAAKGKKKKAEEALTDKKAEKKKTTKKVDAEEPPTEPAEKPQPPKPFQREEFGSSIQEVKFDQPKVSEVPKEKIETKRVELTGPKIVSTIEISKLKEIKDAEKTVETNRENDKRQRKRISSKPERLKVIPDTKPSHSGAPGSTDNRRRGAPQRRRDATPQASEKEIQEKIKNTLAQLSAGSGKSNKSKYRREKRQAHAEIAAAESDAASQNMVLDVTEFISVSELASLMGKSATDVIMSCMSLGLVVSINQRLDAEIIEIVASEFGFKTKFISVEEEYDFEDDADKPEDLKPRAPIVTIMGHVDHGKTSLLDYIRNANVVAGEAGGITQHIGAYEVSLENGKQITFLDTPGHEAFTAMRARGAKITDVAVIVVSADDSVMPQTKEAISHAQAAEVPIIFAINKIDKDGANPENIKQQLAGMNLLVEEWGGTIQSQEISAKKGLNIDLLLEKIVLQAEMLELKANAQKPASGSVIEATLDKGRGYVATILVQDGTLKVGDMLVAGAQFGRIKAMYNERGQRRDEAGPSAPVQILGLDGAPQAGEKFKVFTDEASAKELATKRQQVIREQGYRTKKHITLDEIGRRLALGNFQQLNILVKADVDGSVEALSDSLIKLSNEEIQVNVVLKAVGQISESDVLLASASDAIIIGFNVRPSAQARRLAENEKIEIKHYSIIYDAINDLKAAMEGMLEPKMEEKIVANLEIREVFKITKVGTVAGCFVTEGKILRNTRVRVIREGIVVYSGELASLKRFKDDVKEVTVGMDCGLNIKNFNDIKVGDIIEGYEEVEVKRKLA